MDRSKPCCLQVLLEISPTSHLPKFIHFHVNMIGEISYFRTHMDDWSFKNASNPNFRVLHSTWERLLYHFDSEYIGSLSDWKISYMEVRHSGPFTFVFVSYTLTARHYDCYTKWIINDNHNNFQIYFECNITVTHRLRKWTKNNEERFIVYWYLDYFCNEYTNLTSLVANK